MVFFYMKMELESQLLNNNLNIFSNNMFYDIISQTSYPINHYKNNEKDKTDLLNTKGRHPNS